MKAHYSIEFTLDEDFDCKGNVKRTKTGAVVEDFKVKLYGVDVTEKMSPYDLEKLMDNFLGVWLEDNERGLAI